MPNKKTFQFYMNHSRVNVLKYKKTNGQRKCYDYRKNAFSFVRFNKEQK